MKAIIFVLISMFTVQASAKIDIKLEQQMRFPPIKMLVISS